MRYSVEFEEKGSQERKIHTVHMDDYDTAQVTAGQFSIQFEQAILKSTHVPPVVYKHGVPT